ncbi:MAG: hypothetical protein M3Q64_01950 [bacterium]|nr:hypothetical protein [bacterium]
MQYTAGFRFADPDGFYHAKVAQLIQGGMLSDSFPWLQFATWNNYFADQHYIYHVLLIPFASIQLLPWSVVVFSALSITVFALLLRQFRVKYVWLWVILLLIGSVDFLFRINLVKANTLSLVLLFAAIMTIVHYRQSSPSHYWRGITILAIISALFVGTYGGFVFLPVIAGLYLALELVIYRKVSWWIVTAIALGIGAGIFLHPQHSSLLHHLYDQIFNTGLGAGSVVPAGSEWLPFNLDWFFKSNSLLIVAFILNAVVLLVEIKSIFRHQKKDNLFRIWLFLITVLFLGLTLWHRRFIEYWAPFAILSAALALKPYLAQIDILKFRQAVVFSREVGIATVLIVVMVGYAGYYNVSHVVLSLRGGEKGLEYKAAAEWLAGHSQPGEVVLNTQWDQFPALFYWNSKNYYIVGMDPTFMYVHSPSLYWQWRKIADDNPSDWQSLKQVHGIMRNDLRSTWLFVDKNRNADIYEYVLQDITGEYFESAYTDDQFAVIRVK